MRSSPTALDRYFRRIFGDDEPSKLGSGRVGGVGSVLGGALGLSGVLCLHFPQLLTAPVLRAYYPVALLRGVLQTVLIASVMLGLFSVARRRRKVLGLTGIFLAVSAMALGGAAVPLPDSVETKFGLGLEWFALNLLALALIFVPLERALPRRRDQQVFRPEWTTDGIHFLLSHMLVQAFSWASLFPSRMFRDALFPARDFALLGSLPTCVDEGILKNMGDEALGVYSASWYSATIDSEDNRRFVQAVQAEYSAVPGFYTVGTYTAGLFLEEALKAVKGRFEDKAAFVRALHAVKLRQGPMGPIRLDEYGKPVLNIYVRRVERKDGRLVNAIVATVPEVSQFWRYEPGQFLARPPYSRDVPQARNLEP